LTVAFVLVAVGLFALGSWAFVSSLSGSMLSAIDAQLVTQAAQAAQYVRASAGTPPSERAAGGLAYVVQLLDPAGRVSASSSEAEDEPILAPSQLARARHGRITVTLEREDEVLRVVAEPFPSRSGWVVLAGVSLGTYEATVHRAETGLVLAGAVFTVAVAAGAFGLATASLRPVERLRREVAELARYDAPGTVAVPPTRDEIAALAATMNVLLVTIHSVLARERNLIADVSHELRTPFAVLQGELELASRPGRSMAELHEAVARASEEAGRLSRLADDLLLLSRSDQGHLVVDREPTDVQALLAASARHRAERARARGVTCREDAPSGLMWDLDSRRIRQALDNLVDNALRFAPSGTEVVLAAWQEEASLVVTVADAGPGFPADYLPHAFERFRRPDASRSRSEGGAGLGLSIVAAIAAAHGGSASAANRLEGGAVVTLRLPSRRQPDEGRKGPGVWSRPLVPPTSGAAWRSRRPPALGGAHDPVGDLAAAVSARIWWTSAAVKVPDSSTTTCPLGPIRKVVGSSSIP
jgi:signal transduction histidine kinase